MRIVFVIPYFYPAWEYGGQPRSAFELAKGLVMEGHTVKVLTTDSGGANRLRDVSNDNGNARNVEGIEVFYYRNISNGLAFRYRIFWPPNFFRDIQKQLSTADLVHIHELRTTLTIAAFHAGRKLALPMVLSPHGGLRHLGRKAAKVVFDSFWGNRVLTGIDALIAVSPLEEREAKQLKVAPRRIRRVPNAVSLSDWTLPPDAARFRSKWRISNRRLVMFLGRLHWIKGADLLLRGFHEACRSSELDAHLVLAGPDDGQEKQLRHFAAELNLGDLVTFAGFLDKADKFDAFAAADLIVIPSRSEVFAITALEALLCSRPVLVSSVCGLSPLLGAGEGVTTFASENVHDLALKLAAALRDQQLRSATERGRDFVVREFSLPAVAQKAEAVYREVLLAK